MVQKFKQILGGADRRVLVLLALAVMLGSLCLSMAERDQKSEGPSAVADWEDLLRRYLEFREKVWPILAPPPYLSPEQVEDALATLDLDGIQDQPDWFAAFDVGAIAYSPTSELATRVKHGEQLVIYEDLTRQKLLILTRHGAVNDEAEAIVTCGALPWPKMDANASVAAYLSRELTQRRIVWLVTLVDESQVETPDAGETRGGEPPSRMISGGSCTEIVFSAVEAAESAAGIEMGLCVPDGIAHVDIFGTTNLSGFPWFLIATNLVVATNSVVHTWTNEAELAATFAAGDSDEDVDEDGLSDARETMLWGSNPGQWDSDGDGVGDGADSGNGTHPLNPNDPPNVKGTVDYYGEQTNVIRVLAVTDSNSWSLTHSTTLAAPGDFQIANLPASSYWIRAYRDLDGDGALDAWEAVGAYPHNPLLITGQVAALQVTLTEPDADEDGFTDYEESVLLGTGSTNGVDGVDMLVEARATIAQHWGLIFAEPLNLTNELGSAADLADLQNALRVLATNFFRIRSVSP